MNETEFSQILERVCMEEYTLPEEAPVHHFSLKHRRIMKRILALPCSEPEPTRRLRLNRRTVCILIAAIFLAAAAATGAAYVISPFIMKEHSDNTELFAGEISGAPEIIERVYYLDGLPEGYKEADKSASEYHIATAYQHDQMNHTIVFYQDVKKYYDRHYNTEGYYFEKVYISEYEGLYIDWSNENGAFGSVIWDNGEYMFEIAGDLTKNRLLDLAKSAKVFKP